MKPNSDRDRFSDPDAALERFFQVRDLAPADFARRTLSVARRKRRQARVIRFTAWSSGVAACLVLLLGFALWRSPVDQPVLAGGTPPAVQPDAVAAGPEADPWALSTAEELTAALYASFSTEDVVIYAHARELEALLAEAVSLSEEETDLTLEFLMLLAQN